tara:strand:+ start:529 stop:1200 length:672 start_codon:yes stop_codon:yes gene_type:complete
MKNNSFILLKEEKERIKKLYEATTASASGSYNQPMGFSAPGLGGDVEVIDMETTFIDGDNIQDGSTEINLDIEDIADLLSVNEEERIRKIHRKNSTIQEQNNMPEVSMECLVCGRKALKGKREFPGGYEMGEYDYTSHADKILGMIIKAKLGKKPSSDEIIDILVKLAMTIPAIVGDAGFIAYALLNNECGGGKTAFELCMGDDTEYVEDTIQNIQQKLDQGI